MYFFYDKCIAHKRNAVAVSPGRECRLPFRTQNIFGQIWEQAEKTEGEGDGTPLSKMTAF